MGSGGASAYCRAATQVAVLGAAPRSNTWKMSGLNSWKRFAKRVLGLDAHECLPPTTNGLVGWATAFRSRGTFDNYCGAVKSACLMWQLDTSAFREEILWRAKVAIAKRSTKNPGSPGITKEVLVKLVHVTLDENDAATAMLYVLAYWMLLRVPSEGLTVCLGEAGIDSRQRIGKQVVLTGGIVTWHYDRRKNREYPTKSSRPHMCRNGGSLCPVCTVDSYLDLEKPAVGDALFSAVSPKVFNAELRRRLAAAEVACAESYTSKGFRRGHAQDLSRKYGVSPELNAAGNWSSFGGALAYASREELEDLFVTKAKKKSKRKRSASSDSSSSSSSE